MSREAGDHFLMVSVPKHDPARALTSRDLAAFANNAENRVAALLAELAAEKTRLDSCKLVGRRACFGSNCTSGPWPHALARYGGAATALASYHISDSPRLGAPGEARRDIPARDRRVARIGLRRATVCIVLRLVVRMSKSIT